VRVGLIGAGLLGSALGERFVSAGFAVTAFDTRPDCLTGLVALGAQAAGSAREVAAFGEVIVLCLPDSRVSSAVLTGIRGELSGQKIVVDTSTGEPGEMEEMGRLAPRYLDATIAGSSEQVRNREAVVMAGGTTADYDACLELFAAFASRTFHVGGHGAGSRMKLVVNLVLGLNRAALAEGLAFADAIGVGLEMALEVLRSGPAYSTALDRKGAKMLRRDWSPEARLRQHHKDVRLILAEAERNGLDLPLSSVHDRLLTFAEDAGFADADNSAILEAFRKRS
jgi:3-hydroxyisobutyrate dehydrogenase-like beta-hydroxyacid dehydrogenase